MKILSIIIPVYNEKNTIKLILEKVNNVVLPDGVGKEIIVVDDFSTDGTRQILSDFSFAKIILQNVNQGKGAAVIAGLKKTIGDYVIIQDADMEYNPDEYNKLLQPILSGKADVVYGSRFMGGDEHRVLYYWHSLGNKFLTQLSNMFTDLNLTDMETCYKVFTRSVVDGIKDKLESKRFGIEPEITAKIKKYRVYEVGISYDGRTYEDGKKISWKDGFSAIWCIIKYNCFK